MNGVYNSYLVEFAWVLVKLDLAHHVAVYARNHPTLSYNSQEIPTTQGYILTYHLVIT